MTMKRPTIIHIHVPKTAGSTLNFVLSEALGEHKQFLCALPEHIQELAIKSQVERDQIDFIFGHYPYGLHNLFTRNVLYVACLREPRRRVLSFYRFVSSSEDHPLYSLVRQNSNDFCTFLELASREPAIRSAVDNVSVRMLGGSMGLRRDTDYSDLFASAVANIARGNFLVGDTRSLGDMLTNLADILHLTLGPIPRLNVAEEASSFDDEFRRLEPRGREILEEFVRWETILHSVAMKVMDNHRGRVPRSPKHTIPLVDPSEIKDLAPLLSKDTSLTRPETSHAWTNSAITGKEFAAVGQAGKTLALLYSVTGQPHIQARLQAAIADQHRLDTLTGVKCPYRRVLITDLPKAALSSYCLEFFDDFVCEVEAFVHDSYVDRRYFSLSKFRNAGLSYAAEAGLQWVLLCDSDTVIADYALDLPASDLGVPEVYWQTAPAEDVLVSLERIRSPDDSTFSKGNSWFLISARLFREVSFNENIYGYGFEDNEFEARARARGASCTRTSLRVIHKFHPAGAKSIDEYSWARNRAICAYVSSELHAGRHVDVSITLEAIPAEHRDWQGVLILFPQIRRLIQWDQRQGARYELHRDLLKVAWDNFGPETFILEGGVFISDTLPAFLEGAAAVNSQASPTLDHLEGCFQPTNALSKEGGDDQLLNKKGLGTDAGGWP
jgi:hypothetical protein